MTGLPAPLRLRFIGWSALMLALLALFAWRVLPQARLDTDILSLLPHAQIDRDLDAALEEFSSALARRQIFLIGGGSLADARTAAAAFAGELRASGVAEVQLELDAPLRERFALYQAHGAWLVAAGDRALLQAGDTGGMVRRALRAAYTPAGLLQPLGLNADPLGLTTEFLRGTRTSLGNARIAGSNLVVERFGVSHVVVITEIAGNPFSSAVQERVVPALGRARVAASEAVKAPVEIVGSGAVQHAAAAAQRAEHEVKTFGGIEMAAVILLLLLVFGSMRPLLLGVLTLSLAVTAGFTVVHLVFGEVHLLALVFGSSLIGSVIDYSIHFFADRFREPTRWTTAQALHHVGPAILLGLLTTLVGYLVLALVPFPGLEQIAVFCMSGLVVGCGSVLCLYPVLAQTTGKLPTFGPRLGAAIDAFLQGWHWTRTRQVMLALLLIGVAIGVARLRIQDDVKALQQSPQQLVREEQRVRELMGGGVETRFFLVSGESPQATLEAEERLTTALGELKERNAIASWQAVSDSVPSLARQHRDHDLQAAIHAPGGALEIVMTRLGFEPQAIEKRRAEFAASVPLEVDSWLRSPASQGLRHLWLGQVGSRHASVVTLAGITDVPALTSLQLPGVRLVDRIAETSGILGRYRHIMTWLLAAVGLVAAVILSIRFGIRDGLRMLLAPAAAMLTTLGVFGWIGEPFNLFVLLALWLVLGLSIDYGIFLRHGREHRVTAILSVTLSACTTLIAFGLLALSATPFIHSIGLTLLFAITLSWAFALLLGMTKGNTIHG